MRPRREAGEGSGAPWRVGPGRRWLHGRDRGGGMFNPSTCKAAPSYRRKHGRFTRGYPAVTVDSHLVRHVDEVVRLFLLPPHHLPPLRPRALVAAADVCVRGGRCCSFQQNHHLPLHFPRPCRRRRGTRWPCLALRRCSRRDPSRCLPPAAALPLLQPGSPASAGPRLIGSCLHCRRCCRCRRCHCCSRRHRRRRRRRRRCRRLGLCFGLEAAPLGRRQGLEARRRGLVLRTAQPPASWRPWRPRRRRLLGCARCSRCGRLGRCGRGGALTSAAARLAHARRRLLCFGPRCCCRRALARRLLLSRRRTAAACGCIRLRRRLWRGRGQAAECGMAR
jgi:hypothetical protein